MAVHQEGPGTAPRPRPALRHAFAAYLRDRGEQGLGAAYDLGREAVAAQLSVLDLAEAHHAALRDALEEGSAAPTGATLQAAEAFLRESLSTFESVHRGYTEVQEVARLEHEHVEQLRALADASVAINSSMTVEEILQLTADAARGILAAERATVAVMAPDPRLRPLTATSPPRLGAGPASPSRLSAQLTGRGRELGAIDVVDAPGASSARATTRSSTSSRQLASVAISNARLYDRERTIARTLQRSLRPGALPPSPASPPPCASARPGESIELGGDFYDLFARATAASTALIGDVQGKGPDAAAVTALARHTLRAAAAYEHSPQRRADAAAPRAARPGDDDRFSTVAYAHMQVAVEHVRLELACGGHPLPLVVHPDGSVDAGRAARHAARHGHRPAAGRRHGRARDRRRARALHRRRHRGPPPPDGGLRHRELTELLRTCGGLPPDAVAERVEAAVIAASDGRLRDDVAILAFGPTTQPRGAWDARRPHDGGDQWLTPRTAQRARRRPSADLLKELVAHLARTGPTCARNGRAGSARRAC